MTRPPVRARPRRLRAAVVLAGLSLAAVLGACSSDGGLEPTAEVVLDGSPRVPSDEGIATAVSSTEIVVGDRTYRVSPSLQVFSTLSLEPTPLVRWQGAYVQVGVRDDVVLWLAGVAQPLAGDPPLAYVPGVVEAVDDGRLVLEGGTVLRLGDVTEPEPGDRVVAVVATDSGLVVELDRA